MLTDADWTRIARFCFEECPPDARAQELAWIDADPERRALAAELSEINAVAVPSGETWDAAQGWARFGLAGRGLSSADRQTGLGRWSIGRRGPVSPRILVAGGALGVLTVALAVVAVMHLPAVASRAQEGRRYETLRGQQERITLADGTSIILAPESRLTVAGDYGATRRVALDGEAYFTVVHNAARPFSVEAGGLLTRDVGTQFDVRAYPDDRSVSVAVAEGEVLAGQVALRAGEVGVRDAAGHFAVQSSQGLAPYTGWTQGLLVFHDTPLPEALRQISRIYDLKVRLADSTLAAQTVTGSLHNATVDEVLEAVARAVGASVQRQGHQVVLKRAAALAPASRMPHTQTVVVPSALLISHAE